MKLLLCFAILLSMLGCDGPRYQQRFPGKTYTIIPGDDYVGEDFPDFERDVPEEIQHCRWDEHAYTAPHLGGEYTLCQSKNSETEIFVKIQNVENDDTGNSAEICFFPTHIDGDETILLGDKRCRRIDSETIYKLVFAKSLSDDGHSINSVMVVKDKFYRYDSPFPFSEVKGPEAFDECMKQLKMGNDRYCQSFRSKGEYLSHPF